MSRTDFNTYMKYFIEEIEPLSLRDKRILFGKSYEIIENKSRGVLRVGNAFYPINDFDEYCEALTALDNLAIEKGIRYYKIHDAIRVLNVYRKLIKIADVEGAIGFETSSNGVDVLYIKVLGQTFSRFVTDHEVYQYATTDEIIMFINSRIEKENEKNALR